MSLKQKEKYSAEREVTQDEIIRVTEENEELLEINGKLYAVPEPVIGMFFNLATQVEYLKQQIENQHRSESVRQTSSGLILPN